MTNTARSEAEQIMASGGELRESDYEMFACLRVPPELLAGVVIRVTAAEAREYGINLKKSGLLFLYYHPITGQRVACRLRPDDPDVDENGRPKKYIWPWADPLRFFVLPSAALLLADKTVPIVLVEAEKSVLALTAFSQRTGRKLLPVAIGGCWGWHGRIGKVDGRNGERLDEYGPLPDLNWCDGRKVFVLLDSNVATNRNVQLAQAQLVWELRKRKADVTVLNLPPVEGVNGPDDYVGLHGDEAMSKLFDCVVDGGLLLEDLVAYFKKYVRVREEAYLVLAVWVLHCHAFKAFTRTPYLYIESPTAQCGKTQLLEVAKLVLPNSTQMTCSMTAAVLSRFIDKYHAPLLLDEVDKLKAGDKDLYNAVMSVVNGGYKASGVRMILVPNGGDWEVKTFSTFAPKMLAGISNLEPATASRCIPIHMDRLPPHDSVADTDEYVIEPEAAGLQERAAAWAATNLQVLAQARPEVEGLHNRQREVSRPLFAIADLAGGQWPDEIRTAVKRLFQVQDIAPNDDIKVELLTDMREAFGDSERVASADMVRALNNMEDRPWATWQGRGLNQNQLARLLKDFRLEDGSVVCPREMRLEDGRRLRGYERAWFQPIWERYLPRSNSQTVTARQPAFLRVKTQILNRDKESDVTVEKREKSAPVAACHGVTAENVGEGDALTVPTCTCITAEGQPCNLPAVCEVQTRAWQKTGGQPFLACRLHTQRLSEEGLIISYRVLATANDAKKLPSAARSKCLIPLCQKEAQANSPHCIQHQPSLFALA